jgi:carbon monoxide dehydrogenase subunit G
MNIAGTYNFDEPAAKVWDLLMDTAAIASCVPGCKELRPIGEDRYQADLTVAVAAVTGNYSATITMTEKNPPISYRLLVDGSGRMGFVKGDAHITLREDGGKTIVNVDARADVGGAVARVGQRLMEGVARMTMDRFFACLRTRSSGSGVPASS